MALTRSSEKFSEMRVMPREMKDTGIEWIGQIPKHWKIVKVKQKYLFITGFTPDTSISEYYTEDDTGYDWANISDLNENKIINNSTKNKISKKYIDAYKPIPVPKGSLLYSFKLSVGQVAFTDRELFTNEAIASFLKEKRNNLNFLYYSSCLIIFNSNINIYGAKILNQDLIKNAYLPFPPLEEQKKIADLLDKKCQEIEDIKETIESEIKTLDEYKKSIITEAVTKGLDKGSEMKDSGIEWIGQIPKHWKKGKIKQICKIIGSGTTPLSSNFNYYSDGKYNWIQSGDLYKQDKIVKTEKMITQEALDSYLSLKVYKSPFLVMAMYGASVGNLSLSLIDAATNQACCVMKNNKDNDLIYMYYWLTFVKNDLLMKAEGGSQPNISQDKIKNQFIFTPPINEQKAIAEYLDHKTSAINEAIDGKRAQLVALDEYKKSIIYEYVTGKKEA